MPSSRILISSQTLTSSAASVTFSSIPSTYTDLVLRTSTRTDAGATYESFLRYTLNGSPTYSTTELRQQNGTVASVRVTSGGYWRGGYIPTPTVTSNTFGSSELYIPNYTGSTSKAASHFGVQENNATQASIAVAAELADLTSAITSIDIANNDGNFVAGSSFYLYGLKNS